MNTRQQMLERLKKNDERDLKICVDRMATLDAIEGPRVGDHVVFADGVEERIAYIWPDGGVQTSDRGGRYYLGNHGVSFSGGLRSCVPMDSLTRAKGHPFKTGDIWFFHHDWHQADNAVHYTPKFRIYKCSLPAPN